MFVIKIFFCIILAIIVTRHFRAAVRVRSKIRVRARMRMMPLRASIAYEYALSGSVSQLTYHLWQLFSTLPFSSPPYQEQSK